MTTTMMSTPTRSGSRIANDDVKTTTTTRCRRHRGRGRFVRARAAAAVEDAATPSERTREILTRLERRNESSATSSTTALGAGGRTTLAALESLDAAWSRVRRGEYPPKPATPFVKTSSGNGASSADDTSVTFDVVVCGGTLGILVATALQRRGAKTCVVERGALRGREQEWNVSRAEMLALVDAGALSLEDVEECLMIEFNPIRCGFKGAEKDLMTRDILNTGISPEKLVKRCRERFEEAGGTVLENSDLNGVEVFDDVARLDVNGESVRARLVVDCMGFGSPIVRQIRGDRKPDGVCVVVGSCAKGFDKNDSADLIYTCTDIEEDYRGQYFWEAFPASSGPTDRTTYMFTYMDADEARPSISSMLDDYWTYMPKYQGLDSIDDVEFKRILFGMFPTYRDSPLQTEFDRILQIGDASGIQSPLSFGGLAALLRHMTRIVGSIEEALDANALDRDALRSVNAYQPALSAAWLFQRCMMVPFDTKPSRDFINKLMSINFGVMESLGDDVLRPFLQDIVTFKGLGRTLVSMAFTAPLFIPSILIQAGPGPLFDWFKHFFALGAYDVLSSPAKSIMPHVAQFGALSPRSRFIIRRNLEAVVYGAGRDQIDDVVD